MVCTFLSAKPLDWGYSGLEVVILKPHSLENKCTRRLDNVMLSQMSLSGIRCRANIDLSAVMTDFAVLSGKSGTFTYL